MTLIARQHKAISYEITNIKIASTSKRFKGSFAYKAKVDKSWFKKDVYNGIIQRLEGDENNVYYLICRYVMKA